ncbi:MAG: SPOR domain-containing protein, partial [Pseudomonadota bacterium]|nr:SPOR domain-containing protein [Pseudomonadota bacterium]
PVFLDGQTDGPAVISESVTLPGQNESDAQHQTVVLELDRSQPVPSSGTQVPSPPRAQPDPEMTIADDQTSESMTAAPTELPPPPVVSSESGSGKWAVQIASLSNKENANKLHELLSKEYAVFRDTVETGNEGEMQRISVGPQEDRASADAKRIEIVQTLKEACSKNVVEACIKPEDRPEVVELP